MSPPPRAVINELRHLVERVVDLAKDGGPVSKNDGDNEVFDPGDRQRLHIAAPHGSLIESDQESD